MGTRRSRHNKGRKPLYKEHRQHLVGEPAFFERAEFDDELPSYDPDPDVVLPPRGYMKPKEISVAITAEVEAFLQKRSEIPVEVSEYQAKLDAFNKSILDRPDRFIATSEQWSTRERVGGKLASEIYRTGVSAALPIPTVKNFLSKAAPASNAALVSEVEAFLARRKTATIAPQDIVSTMAGQCPSTDLPAWARPTSEPTRPPGTISPNDILAQLYFDKKISGWQASVGRRWQRAMYEATLQGAHCVDWGEPVSRSFGYQARGTVSERQWDAMKFRNSVHAQSSGDLVRALDIFLDFDMGRASLSAKLKLSQQRVIAMVAKALNALCAAVAKMENDNGTIAPTSWHSGDRPDFRLPFLRRRKAISPNGSQGSDVRQSEVPKTLHPEFWHDHARREETAGVV